ncbi:MAG TPA: hypothetical protein VEQ60_02090, partial [Longimicrobium sp.]|nr:hypothetical protein [Longimicrobium sp.]
EVTLEQFNGAQRFIDAQLIDEIARSKFGPPVAVRRDDPTDRVLQEAIRLLQQAPDTQALIRSVQQAPGATRETTSRR